MKLNFLYEMDEHIRKLERLAALGDPEAAEQLKVSKVRSLGGWQRKVYGHLEMAKTDVVTAAILPQLLHRSIPIEVKVRVIEMMVRDLLPEWVGKVDLRVQEVIDKDWDAVNRSSFNARPGLAKEGEGWWPHWDTRGTHRGYLLDSWVRILAGMETNDDMVEGRINALISKFYYGINGNKMLEQPLLDRITEIIFE